jgi:nucleoside phosphorylase
MSQPANTAPLRNGQLRELPVVVLVTVNEHETDALLDVFGEASPPLQQTKEGVTYSFLGVHGGLKIVNTQCEMGAGGIGASQQRTQQAIQHWRPQAVISVGVAFGLDEEKQSIGDVLVSTQIQDYELGRMNHDDVLTPRGDRPSCADALLNRLRVTNSTERRCSKNWPKIQFGLILSGQKLVDNLDYRERLKAMFKEAIGGEMEGTGVYASASAAKTDWIVVKGICDWGHKKNQADKDTCQRLAAKNAAVVLKASLNLCGLYNVQSIAENPNRQVQEWHGGYHGEKISLNFQSVDVRRLLQVIGEFASTNIVVSDSVGGAITLTLKDVPWDQALEIIMQQKGLDMRQNGNVFMVAPREEIATKEKLDFESRIQIGDLDPLVAESFQLNYIKAEVVQKLLIDPTQAVLSRRGSAVVEERSNILFVKDTPSRLGDVRAIIDRVDVRKAWQGA